MSNIGPGPEENRTSESSEAITPAAPTRDRETNQWAMFIHFSILAGLLTPLLSMMLTGMPPIPICYLIIAELIAITLTIRILFTRSKLGTFWMLLIALALSRLVLFFIAGWLA